MMPRRLCYCERLVLPLRTVCSLNTVRSAQENNLAPRVDGRVPRWDEHEGWLCPGQCDRLPAHRRGLTGNNMHDYNLMQTDPKKRRMEINRNSARRARQRKAVEMDTLRHEVRRPAAPAGTIVVLGHAVGPLHAQRLASAQLASPVRACCSSSLLVPRRLAWRTLCRSHVFSEHTVLPSTSAGVSQTQSSHRTCREKHSSICSDVGRRALHVLFDASSRPVPAHQHPR